MTGRDEASGACARCAGGVPTDAAFCPSCGHPVRLRNALVCAACEEPNSPRARFCSGCGALLGSVADAERRVVTVLFADLSGFTTLTEELDAEQVRELVAACLDPLCECVTRWGGFVDKFIGDCVMALFGAPVAYENEEERAVRAALDMHEEIARWSYRSAEGPRRDAYTPRLRIGINAGPVVTGVFSGGGARDYTAVGDPVNVAARLQSLCEPGAILVGSGAFEPVEHIFEFGEEMELRVRNRREPVRARYVTGVRAAGGRDRGFGERRTPLVGRESELAALREAWRRACEAGRAELVFLVGPAGVGKTRLVEELAAAERLADAQVARGGSHPHARSTPWEPIAELLRELYDLSPSCEPAVVVETIAGGAGLAEPAQRAALGIALGGPDLEAAGLDGLAPDERQERVAAVVVRAIRAAARAPRLLVLEDLHWADQATTTFLTRLCAADLRSPVLMVLVARPALAGEGRLRALLEREGRRIQLSPLGSKHSLALLDGLLHPHELPETLLRRIAERAEGNPLFLEETVKALAQRQAIVRGESGRWRLAQRVAELELPDTIESVLSTRLDSLDPSAKRVIQYAAVVGRRFWKGVLAEALAGRPVDLEIERLLESALVHPLAESTIPQENEFAFEHLLLQEVAYHGLLRGLRSELHGAVAGWLERHVGESGEEADALVAYHHERSPAPGRAVPHLVRAARRARARGALEDARTLSERALDVADSEARSGILLLQEEILADLGEDEAREATVAELRNLAEASGSSELRVEAELRGARALLAAGRLEEARKTAGRALELLEGTSDESRKGDAHRLVGRIAHLWGDYPEARRRYQASLELERRAGDRGGEAEILDRLALVAIDTGDFVRSLELFDEALELFRQLGAGALEARTLAHRATALRWLGRHDEAAETARGALESALRCGSRRAEASAEFTLGCVLADVGRHEEALELLVHACEAAAEMGRPGLEARAWLERALAGEGESAREAAERARVLALRSGLVHVEILALTRLSELALADGHLEEADRSSAAAEEGLRTHGNIQGPEEVVLHLRARVLAASERRHEAAALGREAREIVEAKASRLPDAASRRRYRELPGNRAILRGEESLLGEEGGGSTDGTSSDPAATAGAEPTGSAEP